VSGGIFYSLGIVLIGAGIVIIVMALILLSMREIGKGKTKSAGVIVIGSIPIIFGTDKKSIKTVMTLSITLTIALIVAMIVYYWLYR
jgi:uncharacterized protein (TIGR00304 family)